MFMRLMMALTMAGVLAATAAAAPLSDIADAVEKGDKNTLRSLLRQGADVNVPQVDGTTALHWAVYRDDVQTAKLLVSHGADVDARNRYDVPPLSLACTNGNAEIVHLLIEGGADPNATLRGGETVLMTASRTGNLAVVETLLSAGADPLARERNRQTAIMWASAEGHAPVVQALIDAGADYRESLASGFSPMFFAVREGHTDVVKSLIEAGVDVNGVLQRRAAPGFKAARKGSSPLLLAIENGHFELAVALVKAGADPNDERTGYAPLHTMTWVRKPDASDLGDPAPEGSGNLTSLQFIRELVALGADVNARLTHGQSRPPKVNSRGATPFLMAADRADAPMMRTLLDLGAEPFIPNAEGTTPLMAAAGLGTTAPIEEAGTETEALQATKILLELGADINAVNGNGETAMHGAAYGSFPSMVRLLAKSGADPEIWNRKNGHGWTPLFIAEGYRPGNFKPAPATIVAIREIMQHLNLATEGPRPRHVGHYETLFLKSQEKESEERPTQQK